MKSLDIYDCYINTPEYGKMHFDLLVEQGVSNARHAVEFARQWLSSIGVQLDGLAFSLDHCSYCYSCLGHEAGEEIHKAIASQGFYIVPLEGCPEFVN